METEEWGEEAWETGECEDSARSPPPWSWSCGEVEVTSVSEMVARPPGPEDEAPCDSDLGFRV